MEVIFLGTGTSHGIPVIGCDCPVCTSSDPRNNRTRCSVYVRADGADIIIDMSPEFRIQMLREKLSTADAVLITHTHADHLHGLDVDGVIFFFSDGEPFCEYQMEARKAFPDRTVFFAGYTNGQNSYLPSEHAYEVRKGYEYEIEQMHVYIKAPYPLSEKMPSTYREGVIRTIGDTIGME